MSSIRLRNSKIIVGAVLLMTMVLYRQHVVAQFVHTSHDARSGSMGGVFLLDSTRRIGLDYRRDFMLAELADKRISIVLPTGQFGLASAEYNHHGDATYHEQQASFGYLIKTNGWLRVGVKVRWLNMGVSDGWYEPRHWIGADALAMATWGYTSLLLTAGTRPWDKDSPWRAMAQVAFRPTAVWMAVVALESDDRFRVRCGMEYVYDDLVFFRAGMATNPLLLGFGIGVKYGLMSFDLGAELHSVLGVSPLCSIAICF